MDTIIATAFWCGGLPSEILSAHMMAAMKNALPPKMIPYFMRRKPRVEYILSRSRGDGWGTFLSILAKDGPGESSA